MLKRQLRKSAQGSWVSAAKVNTCSPLLSHSSCPPLQVAQRTIAVDLAPRMFKALLNPHASPPVLASPNWSTPGAAAALVSTAVSAATA